MHLNALCFSRGKKRWNLSNFDCQSINRRSYFLLSGNLKCIMCLKWCFLLFLWKCLEFLRYIAIMHPLRPRMSRKTAVIITVIIWTCSSILSLPNIIVSVVRKEDFANGDYRMICYFVWPDGETTQSFIEYLWVFSCSTHCSWHASQNFVTLLRNNSQDFSFLKWSIPDK